MKSALPLAVIVALATAQSPEPKPSFEVATIRPALPNAPKNVVMPSSPNRLTIPSMTLSWLIYTAYGEGLNTSARVTGGPDWVNQTSYAIEGQAAGKSTPRQLRMMLQTLLEKRFALKVRIETTMVDIYALVRDDSGGRLGPNVQEWDGTCGGNFLPRTTIRRTLAVAAATHLPASF